MGESQTKICTDCEQALTVNKFYNNGGRLQDACKKCYRSKRKLCVFRWNDRFVSGVTPADFEASRIAHERLMADIRANPPKVTVGKKQVCTDEIIAEQKILVAKGHSTQEISERLGMHTGSTYNAINKYGLSKSRSPQ